MNRLKDISSSSSYKDKIDYVLTACLYCWLIWISRIRITIQMGVFHVIRLFVLIFLPKRYMISFYRRHIESMKAQDILFGDLESGDDILTAKNLVNLTCSCYLTLPITVVICIICSLIGWDNIFRWKDGIGIIVIILVMVVTIYMGVDRFTTAFDNPQVYLSYFKKFKKQDDEWLKKWKIYTVLLFGGAILSAVMSFGFCCLCVIIYRNVHGPFNLA